MQTKHMLCGHWVDPVESWVSKGEESGRIERETKEGERSRDIVTSSENGVGKRNYDDVEKEGTFCGNGRATVEVRDE